MTLAGRLGKFFETPTRARSRRFLAGPGLCPSGQNIRSIEKAGYFAVRIALAKTLPGCLASSLGGVGD
jgi:hypothetical protein